MTAAERDWDAEFRAIVASELRPDLTADGSLNFEDAGVRAVVWDLLMQGLDEDEEARRRCLSMALRLIERDRLEELEAIGARCLLVARDLLDALVSADVEDARLLDLAGELESLALAIAGGLE